MIVAWIFVEPPFGLTDDYSRLCKLDVKNIYLLTLMSAALLTNGCALKRHEPAVVVPASVSSQTIVTPDFSLAAKVVSVNAVGRFVVLSFPAGRLPKLQQAMFLYRAGLKIAEVRVAGPQEENNIVADLVSGEPQVGDTVREQ